MQMTNTWKSLPYESKKFKFFKDTFHQISNLKKKLHCWMVYPQKNVPGKQFAFIYTTFEKLVTTDMVILLVGI